jgi:hypothetical protein
MRRDRHARHTTAVCPCFPEKRGILQKRESKTRASRKNASKRDGDIVWMRCHANNGKQVAFNLVSCTYRAIVDSVADVRWRILYKSATRSVAQVGIECGV